MDDNSLSSFVLYCLLGYKKKHPGKPPPLTFYKGTTTLDYLLKRPDLKLKINNNNKKTFNSFAFIINAIHSSNTNIGHWIGIVVHILPHCKRIIVRYYDSFGYDYKIYKTIPKYIHNIEKLCVIHNYICVLDVSKHSLQHRDSKVCGIYVAYFIISVYARCNTQSIGNIFRNFKNDKIANDLKVLKFLEDYFPGDYCHNLPIYSNRKASLQVLLKNIKIPPRLCPKHTFGLKKCFKTIKCKCQ